MVTEPLTVASISNPANSNNNSSYNIIRNNSSSIIVVLKLFILMDVIILPNMKCLHRRSVTILPLSSTLQVSLVLDRDFALLHPIKPTEFSLVFVVVNLVSEFILLPFI